MAIEQEVIERLRSLSPEKQREVLDFVESLEREMSKSRRSAAPKGIWADLGVEITDEDIAQARREMWGNFPRDDIR